ncbi:response regulator [Chitinasiproducens palmae]|uniref:Virulence sensor protein BvgS n=1 Tax=Chitinasiproducens palmae TaxID=1770053 RepID=A0A1H2PP07_9BURK|nr:response regulator [Chitinasiproducens palmae]SDV48464.1 Signal transduction histidine kinase [Chitinasiproducens palmae]
MPQTSTHKNLLAFSVLLALVLAVYAGDILTPPGLSAWILYIIPAGLCLFVEAVWIPLAIALASTVMIALGFTFTPGIAPWMPVSNRIIGLVTLWTASLFAVRYIRARASTQHLNWLQRGQMQVTAAIRGLTQPEEIANNALRSLVTFVGARVATAYMLDGGELRRIAAWALPNDGAPTRLSIGEGLAGQAIVDRQTLTSRGLAADYLRVGSSLGEGVTSHVFASPLSADGDVVGVIEMGFVGDAPHFDDAIELLQLSAENIGMSMRAAITRARVENLLVETQHQAEELQVQQEELRVSNEELEERGRALMDSQARLETQQAELEQTNVQLEEHAQRLDRQKQELLTAQQSLLENTRALERASQYKSEFLANMSHELRTPLNSSLILAKLLQDNKDGNLSAEQVRYASTIYSSNTDLLSLINDILDLAKVEAGHMEVEAEPFTVESLVQTLSTTFEPVASEKRLGWRVEIASDAPQQLITDNQRLRQILKNLLSNAFKFTSNGEVTLAVAGAPGERVRLTVRDTGIGIDAEHQAVIFEAFRQADGTTSRKYGGSGLGLSISRELAHLLGGEITVTSQPGQGSTFELTIPVQHSHKPSAASPAQVPAPAPKPAQPLPATPARTASSVIVTPTLSRAEPVRDTGASARGAARPTAAEAPARATLPPAAGIPDDRDKLSQDRRVILVIEDDPAFARILYDLAHELDFDCVHATTGAEGMRLAEELQPSGILLDVGLPDDSGLTVLERLKRDPKTRHLPIHMASVADHVEAALHLGAIGYSLKPTARDELSQAIRRLEERLAQQVRRILIVEDDPQLRENIGLLLKANDVEIDGVGTIADALAKLDEKRFDCVVMDLTLPDGSGYDLLRDMANGAPHSYPPVIVYTGRSLTPDEERRLRQYSKSIIIKGAKSPERLLDEVTLFLHSVESDLPADQQRMLRQARQRDSVFEGRRILLAEDDVRNIFALSHVIEPLGAKLEIARNGREAVEFLKREPAVDLVLMDIMMPEMDGLTAMRMIRAQPKLERLPIIALTAKAMASDRQRCLDAGANDYISKPIEVEKLLSLCRVWLSH